MVQYPNLFCFRFFLESGRDDAKKGETMEKLMKGEAVDVDLNDPDVQAAATKIQASFRGHKVREDVKKHKEEEEAAIKIQSSFCGHQAREKVKEIKASHSSEEVAGKAGEAGKMLETVDTAPEAQATKVEVEKDPGLAETIGEAKREVQAEEAAAQEVEAVSKSPGVAANAEVADGNDKPEAGGVAPGDGEPNAAATAEAVEEAQPDAAVDSAVAEEAATEPSEAVETAKPAEEIDVDPNDPEVQGAVLKIQASFRGHKVREELKAMRSSESLPQGGEQESDGKAEGQKQEVPDNAEENKVIEADESATVPQGDEPVSDDKLTDEKQEVTESTEEGKGDDIKGSED